MKDLSKIRLVKPDQGKAQWVEGQITGIAKDEAERTHLVGIPPLMPCTIIFVHGVNSEGEWYESAAHQFCKGLNRRLGRNDLESSLIDKSNKRFSNKTEGGGKSHSPIIPFYWGYKTRPQDRIKLVDNARTPDRPDAWADRFGNVLRSDGAWGGGPFQNGTHNLLQFWQDGFDKTVGLLDMNLVNPIVGRALHHCPPRTYYVHAARRLAHLVATVRADFPDEPINLVAHSQGTMVTLCALFYIQALGVRGPDTVLLNSSPYRFDNRITDFFMAASGTRDMQSEDARVATFAAAAAIVKAARTTFTPRPAPDASCTHKPVARYACDDRIYVHHSPAQPDWQASIGAGPVDAQGRRWWESPMHRRDDNRGALFVNFDPGDRVIGIAAISGMGWSGIPAWLLDADHQPLGSNVMQRIFARGSNDRFNPPVGQVSGYRQQYYFEQVQRLDVGTGSSGTLVTSDGAPVQTIDTQWLYLDGTMRTQWKVATERALGLIPALNDIGAPGGEGGRFAYSYINAPAVPVPAVLGDDFDGNAIRYDGQAQAAQGRRPAVKADSEQQEDYEDDIQFEPSRRIEAACTPQTVSYLDERGFRCTRLETLTEVEARRRHEVGEKLVSPTNHAAFLRYEGDDGFPVERVLSYDLTVGPGYAFGDEAYWNYLLDLADWKKSDPYYATGSDGMDATGGTLTESSGIEHAPSGIDRRTVAPAFEPRREAGDT